MSDVLNKEEIKKLNQLGKRITLSLDLRKTDLNGIGIPSRTNRFALIEDMIEYLKIHDYKFHENFYYLAFLLPAVLL